MRESKNELHAPASVDARDSGNDVAELYRQLGLDDPATLGYLTTLRALASVEEQAPAFVLSHNSFPLTAK
jgi:hypothetical protein